MELLNLRPLGGVQWRPPQVDLALCGEKSQIKKGEVMATDSDSGKKIWEKMNRDVPECKPGHYAGSSMIRRGKACRYSQPVGVTGKGKSAWMWAAEGEAVKQGTSQRLEGGVVTLPCCLYIEKTETDRADPVREFGTEKRSLTFYLNSLYLWGTSWAAHQQQKSCFLLD